MPTLWLLVVLETTKRHGEFKSQGWNTVQTSLKSKH
ncbi:hypothetical protein EGR_05818 [Echinococcus granulosus]|uniref:Uncharacterized protein n=1 Tax=Echinococcus granulosus TaxID=6210 RepID=W6V043_ECHGR|nr:hypothetical protein EGR_05818 [Echinococcus granulosus]EUB59334.1 hypothetical protein EGR_05818 [Echinococcus granulosus]